MTLHSVRLAHPRDAASPIAGEAGLTVLGDPDEIRDVERLVVLMANEPAPWIGAVLRLMERSHERWARDRAIMELLMPGGVPAPAHVAQLRRNAEARAEALREFGAMSAQDIADLRGSRTVNPHVTTGRWLKEQRVFAVDTDQGRMFPGFQFQAKDAVPKPGLMPILRALPAAIGGWEVLLWFVGSNGWLDGARPVDVMDTEPARVVAAAQELAADLVD